MVLPANKSPEGAPGAPHDRGPAILLRFVLVTAARNEEQFIEKTLESVSAQTVIPERWVIVDDGSTDSTADLVERYAKDRLWIELIRLPHRRERHFAGKVHAFNAGLARVASLTFDIIGNLDADVSLQPDHFEFLLQRFVDDPRLGVAGTVYTQPQFDSMRDSFEGEESVAGPLQLFRYDCFRQIGGYVPNRLGGIDWIAVTTARMKGWRTRSFQERRFHHHRSMGTAERSRVQASFDYGVKDYFMGNSPVWELLRGAYRMRRSPISGIALLSGFGWAAARRMKRPVTRELLMFHRREQMDKLKRIIGSMVRLRPIEKYRSADSR